MTMKLKQFAGKVFRKAASPILKAEIHDSSLIKVPLRSRRIAAQPLANIPVSKRGEMLVMQRMWFVQGRPTDSTRRDYEGIFTGNLTALHKEAMRQMFPDTDDDHPAPPRRRRAARA